MRVFKDSTGQDWSVSINVGSIKRVKTLTGLDLLDSEDGRILRTIADNPVQLGDVLYALVKPEAQAKGITDEQFAERLAGDAIDRAVEVFIAEFVDFFPLARRRILALTADKAKQAEARLQAATERQINSPAFDEYLKSEMEKMEREFAEKLAALTRGNRSTAPPASSA